MRAESESTTSTVNKVDSSSKQRDKEFVTTDDLTAIIGKLQGYNSELILWINTDTTYGQAIRNEISDKFTVSFYEQLTIRKMLDGKSVQFTAVDRDEARTFTKMYSTANGEKWSERREL